MSPENSLILTIPQVAKALQISLGLAYRLAREDALPVKVIKCGRRMLVSKKALEALLEVEKPKVD